MSSRESTLWALETHPFRCFYAKRLSRTGKITSLLSQTQVHSKMGRAHQLTKPAVRAKYVTLHSERCHLFPRRWAIANRKLNQKLAQPLCGCGIQAYCLCLIHKNQFARWKSRLRRFVVQCFSCAPERTSKNPNRWHYYLKWFCRKTRQTGGARLRSIALCSLQSVSKYRLLTSQRSVERCRVHLPRRVLEQYLRTKYLSVRLLAVP